MKFTLDTPGTVSIRSVAEQGIRIADQTWTTAVQVASDGSVDAWTGNGAGELTPAELASVLASDIELLVIGTGARQQLPDRQLMFAFARQGVGLEVMDTAAAARTFNVLIAEGRKVAAILFPL